MGIRKTIVYVALVIATATVSGFLYGMFFLKYSKTMINYITPFILLLNEMSPYLLLGFLFAGLLKAYVPKEKYIRHIAKPNFRSVLWATLSGIPLPLCSCGVIPTGISLHREGASKGATVAFLTSTPQTNIHSIAATYSLLGLPFAIIRAFAAFITGLTGGITANTWDKTVLKNNMENKCENTDSKPKNRIFIALHYGFVSMLQDIGKWLIIGIFIAGLLAIFLPETLFSTYLNNPLLNIIIVLAIALPTYTCAIGSIPMVAVLMMKGLSCGAAFVFLMAAPVTSIASMTVIGKSLGKRTLLIYIGNIVVSALLIGLTIDYLLPASWFSVGIINQHLHCESGIENISLIKSICSITLIGLLVNANIQKLSASRRERVRRT
jgi:uncharacterized membrane protein YraQ (UPF0718 family)